MTTTSITTPTTPREEREVAPRRAAPADWVREEEGRRGEERGEEGGAGREEGEGGEERGEEGGGGGGRWHL